MKYETRFVNNFKQETLLRRIARLQNQIDNIKNYDIEDDVKRITKLMLEDKLNNAKYQLQVYQFQCQILGLKAMEAERACLDCGSCDGDCEHCTIFNNFLKEKRLWNT